MAEMDKNSILGLLQGVLGEEKAKEAGPLIQSFLSNQEEKTSVGQVSSAGHNNEFADTAAMMQQISGIMSRFQEARNTKEAVLLSALKPYLRSQRQPKVDSCLKILQAYEVLNTMRKSRKYL
ncbi:MAG: hypothetical protein J6K51_00815 [Clostridia bacterium]|nr:hypothetical protein [Clostridia bacterium]